MRFKRVAHHIQTAIENVVKSSKHVESDIRAIVSGLPLRSLPKLVTANFIHQVTDLMKIHKGLAYIQFTYDPRGTTTFLKGITQSLVLKDRKFVLNNIPPAYAELMVLK